MVRPPGSVSVFSVQLPHRFQSHLPVCPGFLPASPGPLPRLPHATIFSLSGASVPPPPSFPHPTHSLSCSFPHPTHSLPPSFPFPLIPHQTHPLKSYASTLLQRTNQHDLSERTDWKFDHTVNQSCKAISPFCLHLDDCCPGISQVT